MVEYMIDEILVKDPTEFGNSSHVILPKRYAGRTTYILVMTKTVRPTIHWDEKKKIGKKTFYKGEIVTNAGTTSSFWVEESHAKKTAFNKLR